MRVRITHEEGEEPADYVVENIEVFCQYGERLVLEPDSYGDIKITTIKEEVIGDGAQES